MGNLARDVLFCMPARDVIRYTLFKVTSIDLTNPNEYMYPPKWPRSLFITDQTLIQLIVCELCTLTHTEQFSIVCCICDTCSVFFSKILAPNGK